MSENGTREPRGGRYCPEVFLDCALKIAEEWDAEEWALLLKSLPEGWALVADGEDAALEYRGVRGFIITGTGVHKAITPDRRSEATRLDDEGVADLLLIGLFLARWVPRAPLLFIKKSALPYFAPADVCSDNALYLY